MFQRRINVHLGKEIGHWIMHQLNQAYINLILTRHSKQIVGQWRDIMSSFTAWSGLLARFAWAGFINALHCAHYRCCCNLRRCLLPWRTQQYTSFLSQHALCYLSPRAGVQAPQRSRHRGDARENGCGAWISGGCQCGRGLSEPHRARRPPRSGGPSWASHPLRRTCWMTVRCPARMMYFPTRTRSRAATCGWTTPCPTLAWAAAIRTMTILKCPESLARELLVSGPGPKPASREEAGMDVFDADSAKAPHFVLSQLGSDAKVTPKVRLVTLLVIFYLKKILYVF